MNTNRFDLEQDIMVCWGVVDDLKILRENVSESLNFLGMDPEHCDRITNVLMGMEYLYQIKFEKLFSTFETMIAFKKID